MGGLIAAAIYAYHAHNHEHALFRSKLFENKIYAIGILGNFFARLGGNALPFLLPLMLQVAFGLVLDYGINDDSCGTSDHWHQEQ